MNKFLNRTIQLFFVVAILMFVSSKAPIVLATDVVDDDTTQEEIDEDLTSEEEEELDSIETAEQAPSISFYSYIPYRQFVNYQYQEAAPNYYLRDVIMEYQPDSNGVFQVAFFTPEGAVCYVFQVTDQGLYELARYDDYNFVEDLRYSEEAVNGNASLILPSDLSVGHTYQSGYHDEKNRTIVSTNMNYVVGGHSFTDVVIVEEFSDSGHFKYYYAPTYGLIVVEQVDAAGNYETILQLIGAEGALNY